MASAGLGTALAADPRMANGPFCRPLRRLVPLLPDVNSDLEWGEPQIVCTASEHVAMPYSTLVRVRCSSEAVVVASQRAHETLTAQALGR